MDGDCYSSIIIFDVVRPHSPTPLEATQFIEQEEHDPESNYSTQEINKRLSANPFPAE